MPNLYVGEYCDIGTTSRGSIPIPLDPPLAEQAVEISSQSKQSKTLAAETCIVKLVSDTDCSIAIGADPDATNSVRFLAAGKEQIITVTTGSKQRIAVVASGSGSMSDSLGAFLKIIASPADAQKKLDSLTKQAGEIDASAQALRTATDGHKQAKAAADDAAKAAADAAAQAAADAADLAKQKAVFLADQDAYAAKVKADADLAAAAAKDIANRETALRASADALNRKSARLDDTTIQLDAREKDISDREAAAVALKADYEARIVKLKALAS